MKAMFMSGVRRRPPALGRAGLLALVAVGLVGSGGVASGAGPSQAPDALLPHAVRLWRLSPKLCYKTGDGEPVMGMPCTSPAIPDGERWRGK